MIKVEEFRTGQWSIPVADADDLPECCFRCSYFLYKEFSVGEGACYYFCGYNLEDKINQAVPSCAAAAASP